MKEIKNLHLIAILIFAFLLSAIARAHGQENLLPKVAVEIVFRNDGVVVFEAGSYAFWVRQTETEPFLIQVWKGTARPDDLKFQINTVTDLVLDKDEKVQRETTKAEKSAWTNEWQKVKKTVRVQRTHSYIDLQPEYGKEYELVATTSESGPGGNLYILRYTVGKGGRSLSEGVKAFERETFKYPPPRGKKFQLGMELGLYVPILVGDDGKKFVPIE